MAFAPCGRLPDPLLTPQLPLLTLLPIRRSLSDLHVQGSLAPTPCGAGGDALLYSQLSSLTTCRWGIDSYSERAPIIRGLESLDLINCLPQVRGVCKN
jgi:hypothetical protein